MFLLLWQSVSNSTRTIYHHVNSTSPAVKLIQKLAQCSNPHLLCDYLELGLL